VNLLGLADPLAWEARDEAGDVTPFLLSSFFSPT
jgi:hypothetical protein